MTEPACPSGLHPRPLVGLDLGASKVVALWGVVEGDRVSLWGAAELGADPERLTSVAKEAVRSATGRPDGDLGPVWVSARGEPLPPLGPAGLRVQGVVSAPVASAEAVLEPGEKAQGVVVVGLGAGSTELAAYMEGTLRHASVIPVGGRSMTANVATTLGLGEPAAEWLKCTHGSALGWLLHDEDSVELPCQPLRRWSRRVLSELLVATLETVFGEVRRRIERTGLLGLGAPTCVLTGGGARLSGIIEYAEELLGMPARVGAPRNTAGVDHLVTGPEHATAVGLLRTAAAERRLEHAPGRGPTAWAAA